MKFRNLTIILVVLPLVLPPSAMAAEIYEFYNGIRSLGMGGAAVATVNDETALLVNPAGLGRLRDYFITIFDPEIEAGSNTQKLIGTDVVGVTDPQKALDRCNRYPNQHMHEKAQLFPSIVVPNFGFGVFGRWSVDAEVDSTTNKFSYDYNRDYAAVFGFNFRFLDGIVKLGVNTRVIDRLDIRRDDLDPASTALDWKTLADSGIGVASDAGLILSAPTAWLPTLAGVYRDLGMTSYTWRPGSFSTTTSRPAPTDSSVDVALAIHPILANQLRSTWTVQYNDVLATADETDPMRRIHGGIELNYADAIFVRGGMNQRYWTAGLELAIVNYQFQAATYGEDIGPSGTPREDRRYVLKFAFRF